MYQRFHSLPQTVPRYRDQMFKHIDLWWDISYSNNKKYTGYNGKLNRKVAVRSKKEREMHWKQRGRCASSQNEKVSQEVILNLCLEGSQAEKVVRDGLSKTSKTWKFRGTELSFWWSLSLNPYASNSDVGSTENFSWLSNGPNFSHRLD